MTRFTLLAVLVLSITTLAEAQDLASFEPILLPAFSSGAIEGANGATFRTPLSSFSRMPFRFYPDYDPNSHVVAIGTAMNVSFLLFDYGTEKARGRILFVERSAAPSIAFGYYVATPADFAPGQQRTQLPVVREDEFRRGRIDMLDVPEIPIIDYPNGVAGVVTGEFYRHTLRLYDIDAVGGMEADVTIALQGIAVDTPLLTFRVALKQRAGNDPSFPYYAEVPLTLPCIPFSLHTPCMGYDARITITPTTNNRYWAFVSSTDNVTRHITVEMPQ